ncbi:hypothetical protein [Fulvivirga kasyanovii]|uniref:hypothetical protein n=1 Tax=Fulvivirga kasyanovii TaxID=396812 RepID=UPI0031D286FE
MRCRYRADGRRPVGGQVMGEGNRSHSNIKTPSSVSERAFGPEITHRLLQGEVVHPAGQKALE